MRCCLLHNRLVDFAARIGYDPPNALHLLISLGTARSRPGLLLASCCRKGDGEALGEREPGRQTKAGPIAMPENRDPPNRTRCKYCKASGGKGRNNSMGPKGSFYAAKLKVHLDAFCVPLLPDEKSSQPPALQHPIGRKFQLVL